MHSKEWLRTNGSSLGREEILRHLHHHWGISEGSRFLKSGRGSYPSGAPYCHLSFGGDTGGSLGDYVFLRLYKIWPHKAGAFTLAGVSDRGQCYSGSRQAGIFCFFLNDDVTLLEEL